MAGTITSTGLGSGLDIESLVTKLMAVEQQPITLLQTKEAKETAKLSGLGQIKSTLSNLQTAVQALDERSEFAAFKASVGDTSVATVSAGKTATAGSYSVEVKQLAALQKAKSTGFSALTSAVTADTVPATFSIEIGKTTFDSNGNPTGFSADSSKAVSITIDSSNNTLEGLKNAINDAKAGVTASIVNDGGTTPYHLVITSDNTGTESSFKLSGLSDLSYDPATATGTGFSKIQNAADALLTIDGISVAKQSNVVADAIEGVTLTLSKTTASGTPTTLTVSSDDSAIQTKVSNFVTAFNSAMNQIKSLTSYNAETKAGGTLNGDASVRNIQNQLKGVVTSIVGTGSPNRLSDVGISFNKNGTLDFDSSKFQKALSDKTKDVPGLFVKGDSATGIASQLNTTISTMLGTNGALTARTDGINATIKSMDKRISVLSDRMTSIEARYRAQFTKLDTTISSLNSTSSYLTQQLTALANLANIGGGSSK